jgi:hypothetical protein
MRQHWYSLPSFSSQKRDRFEFSRFLSDLNGDVQHVVEPPLPLPPHVQLNLTSACILMTLRFVALHAE